MAQPNTTRRALLGAATTALAYAGGAAIVGGAAVVASEAKGETLDRSAWDRAMRVYEQAKAENDAYDSIYEPMRLEWQANEPSGDAVEMEVFFPISRERVLDRINPDDFERDLLAGLGQNWLPTEAEKRKALAQIQTLRDYRDAKRLNRERYGIDAAYDRSIALDEAVSIAIDTLIAMPAPDAEALQWKLLYLFEPNRDGDAAGWSHFYIKQTLADAVRLAGGKPAGVLA